MGTRRPSLVNKGTRNIHHKAIKWLTGTADRVTVPAADWERPATPPSRLNHRWGNENVSANSAAFVQTKSRRESQENVPFWITQVKALSQGEPVDLRR